MKQNQILRIADEPQGGSLPTLPGEGPQDAPPPHLPGGQPQGEPAPLPVPSDYVAPTPETNTFSNYAAKTILEINAEMDAAKAKAFAEAEAQGAADAKTRAESLSQLDADSLTETAVVLAFGIMEPYHRLIKGYLHAAIHLRKTDDQPHRDQAARLQSAANVLARCEADLILYAASAR